MKNRTQLPEAFVRKNFESNSDLCYFRINGGPEPVVLNMPAFMMRRLFRLGQAFSLHNLKCLEPDVKVAIGSYELPNLLRELNQLLEWVKEPEATKYVSRLVEAITSAGDLKHCFITVASDA
jgi:hypothetical protein